LYISNEGTLDIYGGHLTGGGEKKFLIFFSEKCYVHPV